MYLSIYIYIVTEDETKGIAEGCLTPNEASGVDGLGSAIDVTTANPSRGHREDTNE